MEKTINTIFWVIIVFSFSGLLHNWRTTDRLIELDRKIEIHSKQCWENHKITHKACEETNELVRSVIRKAESNYGVDLGNHK